MVRIMVATPMFGMRCQGSYLRSVLSLVQHCRALGMEVAFSAMCNESLLQRSRNYLVDQFLRSGFSHLLFVDADIAFCPESVVEMVQSGKEVVGAAYSDKRMDWGVVAEAVLGGVPADKLPLLAGSPDGTVALEDAGRGLVEVSTLKTGLVLMRREVFEKLMIAYPEYFYKPDHPGMDHFNGTRRIQMFYSLEIDPITQELLPEYEFFCHCWRGIGGKLYVLPGATLAHTGACHAY